MHSWRTAKRETDGQRCFNVFEANSEAVTGQQWTHPTRLLWTLQREAGCWRHHSFILNFVLCPRHHHSNYTTPFQTSVDRLGRAGKRNLPLSRSWIRNFSVILWRRCRRSPHSTQCQIMQSFSMIHFLRQKYSWFFSFLCMHLFTSKVGGLFKPKHWVFSWELHLLLSYSHSHVTETLTALKQQQGKARFLHSFFSKQTK